MNILIIGANGFTGRRILNDLVAREIYNITACSLRNDIQSGDGYQFIRTDIRNASEVRALFKEVCPDVVINTSALSVPDFCETHHNEARATNITAVEISVCTSNTEKGNSSVPAYWGYIMLIMYAPM